MDKFHTDETFSHIILNSEYNGLKEKMLLVNACPAGLYKINEAHSLSLIMLDACNAVLVECWEGYHFKEMEPSCRRI